MTVLRMTKDETRQINKAATAKGAPARFDHHPEGKIRKDITRGQTTIMTGNCEFISGSEKIFHVRIMFNHCDELLGAVLIALFQDDQKPTG